MRATCYGATCYVLGATCYVLGACYVRDPPQVRYSEVGWHVAPGHVAPGT